MIREDRREYYERMMSLMPLGSTPMDRESGQQLRRHVKRVERSLREMTPWVGAGMKSGRRRSRMEEPLGSGEITVILDHPAEAKLPVFRGAKTQVGA